jgi:hypothetical protein
VFATQFVQVPPLAPHAVALVPAVQTLLPLQQPAHGPVAHDPAATQRFVVVLQTEPAGQSAALVHPHAPLTHALPFALPAHAPHTAPPVPHCAALCDPLGTQLRPLQHPVAHEVVVHAHIPLTHACPLAHDVHAAPPVPHALVVPPATHWPLALQHPPAHVPAPHGSQTCVVVLQSRPLLQSLFALQPQTPPPMQR